MWSVWAECPLPVLLTEGNATAGLQPCVEYQELSLLGHSSNSAFTVSETERLESFWIERKEVRLILKEPLWLFYGKQGKGGSKFPDRRWMG
jgi:hypothetical protein